MPINVYYQNNSDQVCVLRPAPLISISEEIKKSEGGEKFGTRYNITLTGTLLDDGGFPLAYDPRNNTIIAYRDSTYNSSRSLAGPYDSWDVAVQHANQSHYMKEVPRQAVTFEQKLDAMFWKQKCMRELFARDGQRMEIQAVHGDEASVVCYPRVVNIEFAEGTYVDRMDYTVVLEADTLLDKDFKVDQEGNPIASGSHHTEEELYRFGAFYINNFSDDWAIEVDESIGESTDLPYTYRITRNMQAQASTHYMPTSDGNSVIEVSGWWNARNFVQDRAKVNGSVVSGVETQYPNLPTHLGFIGSGTLNLLDMYRGYSHSQNESVEIAGGSYTLRHTWLLASGSAYENYSTSASNGVDTPFVTVSVEGTIQGLSELPPSGYGGNYNGGVPTQSGTKYANALDKYHEVSNGGQFGLTSKVYKRANNTVGVSLNSQPNTITVGVNEYTGEITYSLEFNNRPLNIISGVLSENIQIQDTYPGDVFAVIPVIGRETGPVLQYIGSRTEYQRNLTIDLLMDYTDIGYGSTRESLTLLKPSIIEPTRSQLRALIKELSPESEPGIRKWFLNPPSESWTPKEGVYNISLSWIYELDR